MIRIPIIFIKIKKNLKSFNMILKGGKISKIEKKKMKRKK